MSFRDLMAADLARIEAVNDFGVSATVTPIEGGGTFALFITPGDQTAQPTEDSTTGREMETLLTATCSLADFRAGVDGVAALDARDPLPGDKFVISSGSDAGTWLVMSASLDPGDGCNVTMRREVDTDFGHPNGLRG